jgi:hypothetical protein
VVDLARFLTYVGRVNAASTRRAALVAALLGLLAFLGGAAVAAPAGASSAVSSHDATNIATRFAAPSSTVGDEARSTQPSAARTTGHDRTPTPYPAGWAVAAALLLLAAAALALGVRRACRRSIPTAWRRALAARAPPALGL